MAPSRATRLRSTAFCSFRARPASRSASPWSMARASPLKSSARKWATRSTSRRCAAARITAAAPATARCTPASASAKSAAELGCQAMSSTHDFERLLAFLGKLPAIDLPAGRKSIGHGSFENGNWWVKFRINTEHTLAWRHVQELGHVLNYVSLDERLPTVFMPVSPPPYMNGGPRDFLSWVIESTDASFSPAQAAEWLEGRLPRPVDDVAEWNTD